MTISEQIKILCIRNNISVAELSRRLNTTPQNFSKKMKNQKFPASELEEIAKAVGCKYHHYFELPNGDKIE